MKTCLLLSLIISGGALYGSSQPSSAQPAGSGSDMSSPHGSGESSPDRQTSTSPAVVVSTPSRVRRKLQISPTPPPISETDVKVAAQLTAGTRALFRQPLPHRTMLTPAAPALSGVPNQNLAQIPMLALGSAIAVASADSASASSLLGHSHAHANAHAAAAAAPAQDADSDDEPASARSMIFTARAQPSAPPSTARISAQDANDATTQLSTGILTWKRRAALRPGQLSPRDILIAQLREKVAEQAQEILALQQEVRRLAALQAPAAAAAPRPFAELMAQVAQAEPALPPLVAALPDHRAQAIRVALVTEHNEK